MTLVFDADDTLWGNEARFHRAVADYITWVAHPVLEEAAIRAHLHEVELANIATHGYGSTVFLRSLSDVVERLEGRPVTEAERRELADLVVAAFSTPPEIFDGVVETLEQLGRRHQLLLLTKGSEEEQRAKIEASGLARHFASTHVVREKDPDTYRRLATDRSLDPRTTWMIGNSPRSDILAARAAGWKAVFIPNEHTWAVEDVALDLDDPGVLRLAAFDQLTLHF
jgi:putative hydrolase of the HAD superfamily